MPEETGRKILVRRRFTAVIRCSPRLKLQVDEKTEKELNLRKLDDNCLSFTVEFEPEKLQITDFDNIHNEIQKNVPDRVLEKVDTYLSALSLALGFGFVLEDLYVSEYEILNESCELAGGTIKRVVVRFKVPFDIRKEHKNEFNKYFGLLSKIDERYRGHILRAIKWWARGCAETDELDKFIDFYIALEILSEVIFPDVKGSTQRVKQVCKKYNLNCNFESKHVTSIRSALFHSGQYEGLARAISDVFGNEVLKAILCAIHELSLIHI